MWLVLKYCAGIRLQRPTKTTNNLNQAVSMIIEAGFRVTSCIQVSTNLRNYVLADYFKSDCDCLAAAYILYYVITSVQGSGFETVVTHFVYGFLQRGQCLSTVSNYRMISEMTN